MPSAPAILRLLAIATASMLATSCLSGNGSDPITTEFGRGPLAGRQPAHPGAPGVGRPATSDILPPQVFAH